jgi:hypothetical protein
MKKLKNGIHEVITLRLFKLKIYRGKSKYSEFLALSDLEKKIKLRKWDLIIYRFWIVGGMNNDKQLTFGPARVYFYKTLLKLKKD